MQQQEWPHLQMPKDKEREVYDNDWLLARSASRRNRVLYQQVCQANSCATF